MGKSFLRMTYERFLKVVPQSNILVITAEKYRDLVLEHIPELAQETFMDVPGGVELNQTVKIKVSRINLPELQVEFVVA